jgi:hypothetical protein
MYDVYTPKISQITALLVRARDLGVWVESHGRNPESSMQGQ